MRVCAWVVRVFKYGEEWVSLVRPGAWVFPTPPPPSLSGQAPPGRGGRRRRRARHRRVPPIQSFWHFKLIWRIGCFFFPVVSAASLSCSSPFQVSSIPFPFFPVYFFLLVFLKLLGYHNHCCMKCLVDSVN